MGYDLFGNPYRKVWGYYFTAPGGQLERPPNGEKGFLSLVQDRRIGDHYSVARGVPEVVDLTSEITEQSSAKRKAEAKLAAVDRAKKPNHGSPAAKILVETYWDSPKPRNCFSATQMTSATLSKYLSYGLSRQIRQVIAGVIL
jgi:hypothetical protein